MVTHHEVILSAPRDLAEGGAPAILQRSDDDFIEAVLAGLRDAGGRVALRASLARAASVASGTDSRPRGRLTSATVCRFSGSRAGSSPAVRPRRETSGDRLPSACGI